MFLALVGLTRVKGTSVRTKRVERVTKKVVLDRYFVGAFLIKNRFKVDPTNKQTNHRQQKH